MSILGIRVGAGQIRAGRVDTRGALASLRTDKISGDPDALVTTLHYIVAAGELPESIGVACDGVANPLLDAIPDMIRPALRGSAPIHTGEAGRAALVAETVWGAARGKSSVVMLTLGETLSGAVMVDGRVLRGGTEAAGQVAHFPVDPAGPLCSCGGRGCLDAILSARAIEAEALAALQRGCASRLTRRGKGRAQELSWRTVFDAAQQDRLAAAIVERAMAALRSALLVFDQLFDPEIVLLGGEMAPAVRKLLPPQEQARLKSPRIDDESGVVAAAALAARAANVLQMPK